MKKIFVLLLFMVFFDAVNAQHQIPRLAFKLNALEPFIDSLTMDIHINQHHVVYVSNLNALLNRYPPLQKKNLIELMSNLSEYPLDIQMIIRNNGGGHFNHSLFWSLLAPAGTAPMSEWMKKRLSRQFGSVESFKTEFEKAALGRFGSGWVWLVPQDNGKLRIVSTANQDNPLMSVCEIKGPPVLCLDVWEHAYYLKYKSKRSDYVKAFWNLVNWPEVERLLKQAE